MNQSKLDFTALLAVFTLQLRASDFQAQSDVIVEGETGPWIIQRPKVIFNNHTKLYVPTYVFDLRQKASLQLSFCRFVLYFHLDQPPQGNLICLMF